MTILSIDLASRNYSDLGLCHLAVRGRPEILNPAALGLTGAPSPVDLASAIDRFCRQEDVSVLLLDGPQGWRWPESSIQHMRLCERVLNTPARTGDPGQVKPRTYLHFVQFSIEVFREFRLRHGWSLLVEDWPSHTNKRWVVETFPSVAWDLLGLPRLPGKQRCGALEVEAWRIRLEGATPYTLPKGLSHDELQAIAALPAGEAIAEGRQDRVLLAGIDPIISEHGLVFEGLIACPRTATGRRAG